MRSVLSFRDYRATKLLFAGLIFSAMCAHATESIQQKWVSTGHSLAGQVVVFGTGEPVIDATVELCSPGWKQVIASTKTDQKGHFSLEPVTKSKLYYLRASAPGMDIYQLRVRIETHSRHELKIRLRVAT